MFRGRAETNIVEMSRHATDVQQAVLRPLPADHVLSSAAVLFPGAYDQQGCPLVVFPEEEQTKLCSQLSKAEVVDFINYFLCLHNKQQKDSLVSVVADLRLATLPTTKFIAETLLLLELDKRTVHTVYIVQPRKKDVVKLLLKLLSPSKSYTSSFKKVLLQEVSELSNYIDRSQLTASLGGYLIYCHQSWVAFIKEIAEFVERFVSVVQRLPSCISALQALSRLPLPSTFRELQLFCSTNKAKFLQLRRELGLDELLRLCDTVVDKLGHPERESCYQDMAGTALFTHIAFDMLQNHSRITAAVEKLELLWQQTFSKAGLQLQVFQLRDEALQITDQIQTLLEVKLQPYRTEISKDAAEAAMLVSQFEASIHTPAMALIRSAEDTVHTVSELQIREHWVLDLERLKEKLHSAVLFILQTLRAVSTYHQYYNKANSWYSLVLGENFLQVLLSGVHADGDGVPTLRQRRSIPAWRYQMSTFLKKSPAPDTEELLHLAHLSKAIPDEEVQQAGGQMSQRCMILRNLLMSNGPVAICHLQQALQWQYDLLRNSRGSHSSANSAANRQDLRKCERGTEAAHLLGSSPSTVVSGTVPAVGKPSSLTSCHSGFGLAGSSHLEAWKRREQMEGLSKLAGTRDSVRPAVNRPLIHKENLSSSVPECGGPGEESDPGSVGNRSRLSIQVIPKVTVDSLNLEIKVKHSSALPSNPWLSLPVDDLENLHRLTFTQSPTLPNSNHCTKANRVTQTEVWSSTQPRGPQSRDWIQSNLEDPELSPIRNVLSSTITEGKDKSMCLTEGNPSLLWDSYDLHDQNQDDSVTDLCLHDWDVKEQEDLRKVEKILDRADEILETEESVLAQEAALEALLRSEDRHHQWPLWDTQDQLGMMSSNELAEAGVLVLEDYLDTGEFDHYSEPRSTESASGSKAPEDDGCIEAATADTATFHTRPDLLTELRKVHMLDELIMEENLKIHKLRNPNKEVSLTKPPDTSGLSNISKERVAYRVQLEKEKREVEKLEKSLDKERKVKKHKDRTRKVVRCSIMERARNESKEDQDLCDELLSSQRIHSTSLVPEDSQAQDTDSTEHIPVVLDPGLAKEAIIHDLVQLPDSYCQDCSGTEPLVFDRAAINNTSGLKKLCDEVGLQLQGSIFETKLDRTLGNASVTPEMKPDDGMFDPGGKFQLPPVPKPRQASLHVLNNLAEHEPPHSTELQNSDQSSFAQDPSFTRLDLQDKPPDAMSDSVTAFSLNLVLNPNVKEHRNNNNNSQSGISTEGFGDLSVVPTEDEPPEQPLEFDEPDGVQSYEATRTSGSPRIQAQLHINMRQVTDFKTPIVLDAGSGLMKAGFADQVHPNVIFPTIIGTPKYEEIMNGNIDRETYIGHEAQHMRGVLALRHPIKNGIIRNWDDMEKIWHHTFQQLSLDPDDHPVLLTEAAMNPLENRQHMVEIMFESFNVPFTYVAMQAVLALYAAGRSTGVVFDSGDGVSHSVPVFEGYCLPHAVQRFPLAGADVTMHLKKLLQEQGVCLNTTAEMEIVREMKESCCCVALDYEAELSQGGASCTEMHYTMPDGQIVTLCTERFRASEILFKPELIGRDHYGMHENIFKSILSSDIDLRRCFLRNIVLSGGNTLLPGLPERLQAEIQGLLPTDMGGSVVVTSPRERDFSVWSGGAVLASLPSFSSAWISMDDYEEHGPGIVFRKCF